MSLILSGNNTHDEETREEKIKRLRKEANKRYYMKHREEVLNSVKNQYNKKRQEDEEEFKRRTRENYKKRYDENEKYKHYKKMYYEKMKHEFNENKQFYLFLKNGNMEGISV